MNDRFKFRHFNKLVGKMTYYDNPEMQVCLNDDFKSGLIFPMSEDFEDNAMYMGKYTYYQQCTGLRDKNGKLIFEGDIVKNWDNRIFKIVWKDDACCFMAENKNFTVSIYSLISLTNDLEVIGNIYENKELVEG